MDIKTFIKENRQELDRFIQDICPGAPKNDHERELWVLNNEELSLFAENEGVTI